MKEKNKASTITDSDQLNELNEPNKTATTNEKSIAEDLRYLTTEDKLDNNISLFNCEIPCPTDRAYFPSTINPSGLIELIVSHGTCKPVGPFEENEGDGGRAIFTTKHYYFYSAGNLRITRDWLCFSPILKKPSCQTCWLFADRQIRTQSVHG